MCCIVLCIQLHGLCKAALACIRFGRCRIGSMAGAPKSNGPCQSGIYMGRLLSNHRPPDSPPLPTPSACPIHLAQSTRPARATRPAWPGPTPPALRSWRRGGLPAPPRYTTGCIRARWFAGSAGHAGSIPINCEYSGIPWDFLGYTVNIHSTLLGMLRGHQGSQYTWWGACWGADIERLQA